MITNADVTLIDKNRIFTVYEKWPEHFKSASNIQANVGHEPAFYKSIILGGMGGSATSCDILCDLMYSYSSIPTSVVRSNNIPSHINKHSLVIVHSVSGNTEETLSMMEDASRKGAEVICISSGGKLKEAAANYGHRYINIPNLSLPRASLPYLLIPGLKLVSPFLNLPILDDLQSLYGNLSRIANEAKSTAPDESNISKKIANFIEGGFAFCLTSPYLVSAGVRFKNSLNENAKVHCIVESVMEASHNEIVPFTFENGLKPKVLILRWAQDDVNVKRRFEKIKMLFDGIRQPYIEIMAFEKSLLNAIVSSIYILDYSTIYMAVLRKMDPSSTPAIDILKGM